MEGAADPRQVEMQMSPGDVDVEEAGTASVLGVHRGRGGAALSAPIPLGYKPPRSVQPPGVGSRLWQALRVVVAVALALGCFGVGIAVAPLIVSGRGDDKSGGTSAVNGIVGGTGVYAAAARTSDDYLSFLVVGDWGRRGAYNQTAVGRAMGLCGAASRPDFVVSVGDNFYEGGLNAADDPEFTQSFTQVYTHPSLQVPWHVVLGNHDYGDCGYDDDKDTELACPLDADANRSPSFQLDPALRRRDWRWRAGRTFDHRPTADTHLFFVDTNPLVSSYATKTWASSVPGGLSSQWKEAAAAAAAGAGDGGRSSYTSLAASALKKSMEASDARWKLVFGHHPMRSNGFWSDVNDVREALEMTVARGGAAAYFNGHDHDMQHTIAELEETSSEKKKYKLHHFTSGAGSKTGRGFGVKETKFEHDGPGFASVRVSRGAVKVQFWRGGDGEEGLLYSTEILFPENP